MSFTASATIVIRAEIGDAFAKFTDHSRWKEFMPRQFAPLSGPERPLRAGDRVRVLLDTGALRLPAPLRVLRVEAPRELAWGGGNALLRAEHRFVFEQAGAGEIRIRSDEDWTGLLSHVPAVARRVQRQTEKVERAQLEGFRRWVEG